MAGECNLWAGSGSRLLALIELELSSEQDACKVWIWVWKLDLRRPDGCQFGFGGGSRPLVFFRWCTDWMPPILNNLTCGRRVEGLGWA